MLVGGLYLVMGSVIIKGDTVQYNTSAKVEALTNEEALEKFKDYYTSGGMEVIHSEAMQFSADEWILCYIKRKIK